MGLIFNWIWEYKYHSIMTQHKKSSPSKVAAIYVGGSDQYGRYKAVAICIDGKCDRLSKHLKMLFHGFPMVL